MRLWKSLISSSLHRLRVRASYLGETWQGNWEDGDESEKEHGKEKVTDRRGRGLGGRSASKHQKKRGSAQQWHRKQQNQLKQRQKWVDVLRRLASDQPDSRRVAFASHTSHVNVIPLPIPFIGL